MTSSDAHTEPAGRDTATAADAHTDTLPVTDPDRADPAPDDAGATGSEPDDRPRVGLARRAVGLVLVVLPLVLAALWAVVGPEPQRDEDTATSGGPVTSALSDASANSSFTVAGAEQLREGSAEFAEGAGQLRDGSAELASGMEQLQAGMGQAGSGANEVAGGVSQVVGAVRGVAVIQGQVSTAIEDALTRLQGDAPEVVAARDALNGLKQQLATQGMDQNTLDGLDQLDSGAAELARQLSQPGADLRDGIYEATAGARTLATGAGELSEGADSLRDGAAGVADSATRTQDGISRTGRALATEQGDAGAAAAVAADDSHRRTSAGILGVAAAAVLGALLVQLVRRPGSARAETVLALTLLTAGLSAWALATAEGPGVAGAIAVVGVVALVVVASHTLFRALSAVFGAWPGRVLAAVLAAVSAGVTWWVWVAGGAPSAVVTAASATTTSQATAVLDALLLQGPAAVAWTGAVVLAAVAVCALLAIRVTTPRR